MAAPVLVPVPQFCDADGHPYAGGSITTYIPDTSTPKATWVDPDQLAYNTNPIILDAAGRCQMWGDGEYRLILRDAAGNLVWDAPSTTLVSAAMAPVILAPTTADAVEMLGIPALIAAAVAAEAAARSAADVALQAAIDAEAAARAAADALLAPLASPVFTGDPQAPTPAPGDNDTSVATTAFVTAAIAAALAGLGGDVSGPVQTRTGTVTTTASGTFLITFSTPFPTACLEVTGHGSGPFPELYFLRLVDADQFPVVPTAASASGTGWGVTTGAGAGEEPPPETLQPMTEYVYVATGY